METDEPRNSPDEDLKKFLDDNLEIEKEFKDVNGVVHKYEEVSLFDSMRIIKKFYELLDMIGLQVDEIFTKPILLTKLVYTKNEAMGLLNEIVSIAINKEITWIENNIEVKERLGILTPFLLEIMKTIFAIPRKMNNLQIK